MANLILEDCVINGVVVISLVGSLDTTNANTLKELMDRHLDDGRSKFLLDYRRVEYISSAGWGVLLGRIKRIRERAGELIIAGMTPEIESIFKILELDRVITTMPTLDEAAEHLEIKIPIDIEKKEVVKEKTVFDVIIDIIESEPLIGFFRLRDRLAGYNYKFNIFQFYALLKEYNLDTKVKRLYFLYNRLRGEK